MPEVDRSTQPQRRSNVNAGSDRCRNIALAWIPICVVITILFIFATHLWAALITFVILLFMISFSLYYYYAVMPHDIEPVERCEAGAGLSPSIVKENPAFVYQRDDGGELNKCDGCDKAGLRCAVCIGTVHDGDLVRQLLMCKHVFHTDCIDSWLPSHSTCPMCRADVKTGRLAPSEQPAPPV